MGMYLITRTLLLVISATGLACCSTRVTPENSSQVNIPTNTTIAGALPETDPLPHPPYGLDDIDCYDMVSGAKRIEHWADRLVPGESSISDLERLVDLSTQDPVSNGLWEYRDNSVQLRFWDGILRAKSDPRTQLGDIILEYGIPEQIVWHIPRTAYHLAKYDTILLYPQIKALFHTEEQVIDFGWETDFKYSRIVILERYMELTAQYVSTEDDDYQFFTWPCSNR